MPDLSPHIYRAGSHVEYGLKTEELTDTEKYRKQIEPWLTAVFQSEHLSLLLGNGFTISIANAAEGKAASMSKCEFKCDLAAEVDKAAERMAMTCGRGAANIEDQLRSAMQLLAGLEIMNDDRAKKWRAAINSQLKTFMGAILNAERAVKNAAGVKRQEAEELLVSFLLSFASRAATRERLNLLTTNYDRLIEYGCDLAGLHVIDRFVGALSPIFRATRLNVDVHYNPPGIRGEPRYLEGVIRLNKLHGSVDWRWESGELRRYAMPFAAPEKHPAIPDNPADSVMIYPNPAKDVETLDYPYAELFRDFAAATCRPNSSLVTYGYGYGDDHINRIIKDMLAIPSTHLVIMAWDETKPDEENNTANTVRKRIMKFCKDVGRSSQISLLLGSHFGDIKILVENYLPKPAIDQITIRQTILKERRGESYPVKAEGHADEQAH